MLKQPPQAKRIKPKIVASSSVALTGFKFIHRRSIVVHNQMYYYGDQNVYVVKKHKMLFEFKIFG